MRLALFGSLRGQPSMERFARELAGALCAADPECAVTRLPPADFPRRPFHWRKYVSYQRAARRWAGEVNHVVDHGYAHLVRALPAGRSVVTVHDLGPLWKGRAALGGREGGGLAALAWRHSLRAMERSAAVVAVSEATRAELLERTGWPAERVRVIPPGLGAGFRPGVDPAPVLGRLGLTGVRYVLHVGGSSARKNLAAALRALAALPAEIHLVKAGAPLELPERRLARELGLVARVRETGAAAEEDLPGLYAGAEALVFPSLHEGFGWPPLEAMACGTPAVVSGIPALREAAGPGAVVVEEPGEAAALAAALGRCLRGTPGRGELRARGLARAAEFTWARCARSYLEVYREVLGRGRS